MNRFKAISQLLIEAKITPLEFRNRVAEIVTELDYDETVQLAMLLVGDDEVKQR